MAEESLSLIAAREHIAKLAEKDGEIIFAREVRAGCWDHRDDVQAALVRELAEVQKPDPKQNALVEQRRQIDRLKKVNDDLTRKLAEAERTLADERVEAAGAIDLLKRQLAEAVELITSAICVRGSSWDKRARAWLQKVEARND